MGTISPIIAFRSIYIIIFLINHNSIKQTVKQKRARVLIKVQGVEKRVDIVVNSKSRIAVGQCADCNQELTVIAHPNA